MANSAIYSSLSTFRDIENTIVAAAINEADIFPYMDEIPNVKGPTRINVAEPYINFSTTSCNRTANSGVSYSWINVDVCQISDFSTYCGDDLLPYMAKFQEPGSTSAQNPIPFPQFVLELRGLKWADEIGKLIVKGDTTSTTNELNMRKCDGIIKKLYDASASTTNVAYVALTPSNAKTQVRNYVRSLSGLTTISNRKTRLYLSYNDYLVYLDALDTANGYNPANFAPSANGGATIPNEMQIVGTNCSIVGLTSLNGMNKGWICVDGTMKLATNLASELKPDAYNFWWSQDSGVWMSEMKGMLGVAIANPTQVVRIY